MPKHQDPNLMPAVPRKTDLTHCIYCRETIKAGDRVIPVYLAKGIGYDSQAGCNLVAVSEDYELAHGRCTDKQGDGYKIIIGPEI